MEKSIDLLGDKIPQKRNKPIGIEKSIYFTQINCPDFEQFSAVGSSKNVNLGSILTNCFNKQNSNYQKDSDSFSFDFKKQTFLINIIELNNDFCFGRLSTEKQHNDILEEYSTPEVENITYKTLQDCNKHLEKILKDLRLTPEMRRK